jgi:hypothetical protein
MDDKITIKEAYAAMYAYLKMLYDMTGSDDLGGFWAACLCSKTVRLRIPVSGTIGCAPYSRQSTVKSI